MVIKDADKGVIVLGSGNITPSGCYTAPSLNTKSLGGTFLPVTKPVVAAKAKTRQDRSPFGNYKIPQSRARTNRGREVIKTRSS